MSRSILLALASLLFAAPVSAQSLPNGVYPVLSNPSTRSFAVLGTETQPEWARGRRRLVRREGPTIVTRPVRLRALPDEVRGQLRGTVRVSNDTGEVCRARLGRPRVLRHVDAGWEIDTWNGLDGGPRFTDAQVAEAAWRASAGFELLVAPLIRVSGDCDAGRWATRAAPTFGHALTEAEPALLSAFRELPSYRDLAEGYESVRSYEEGPPVEHWDERLGGSARAVHGFVANGRRFSLISAEADPGCGDFVGGLWALYEHGADGLELVDTQGTGPYPVSGLADLDGDGVPEVLAFRRLGVTSRSETVDVNALFLGCPC